MVRVRRPEIWTSVGLVLVGCALRVIFIHFSNPIQGDPQIYANIARNLLQHGVYSFAEPGAPLTPTLIRLPGYPLFLLVCFHCLGIGNFVAIEVVQMLFDLGGCILLSLLAKDLFGMRVALWTLAASCLCPFTANYTATPLTETLTLLTISWTFLALLRGVRGLLGGKGNQWRWWLASLPVSLGYSLLLRPEQGLLSAAALPIVGYAYYTRQQVHARNVSYAVFRSLLLTGVLGLAAVIPLAPWAIRNWQTFHVLQPLAPHYANDPGEAVPFGFQRWYRSWAIDFASTEEVYWNYDGSPILLSDLPSRAFATEDQKRQTAALLADYNKTVSPTAQLDARFQVLAEQRKKTQPFNYYVLLPLARLANMLLRPRTELMNIQLAWWRWREAGWQTLFAAAYAGLNALYLFAGLAGWKCSWKRVDRSGRLTLIAMSVFGFLRCVLLLTLDNSEPRYTLELFPLLIVWAGAFVLGKPAKAR